MTWTLITKVRHREIIKDPPLLRTFEVPSENYSVQQSSLVVCVLFSRMTLTLFHIMMFGCIEFFN